MSISWKDLIYSELKTVDAIAETVGGVYECTTDEINEFVETIDVTRVNLLHALAILRMNFARRALISGWYGFRDRMYREIERRGEDADRIMVGLFKE